MQTSLNHHAAMTVPIWYARDGTPTVMFEQKTATLKSPFFDGNRLNLFGGNAKLDSTKVMYDRSPRDTLLTEIAEEFGHLPDHVEHIYDAAGNVVFDPFQGKGPKGALNVTLPKDVQAIGDILLKDQIYSGDTIATFNTPLMKAPIEQGSSYFVRELSDKEFKQIKAAVDKYDGVLTTDSRYWGDEHRTQLLTPQDIIGQMKHFAWGHGHALEILADHGAFNYNAAVSNALQHARLTDSRSDTHQSNERTLYEQPDGSMKPILSQRWNDQLNGPGTRGANADGPSYQDIEECMGMRYATRK